MEKSIYDHASIEAKWLKIWQEQQLYKVDTHSVGATEKYYALDMFPYPSGHGLHVGHWRGYVLSDFYARYNMLHGKTVLHPMGFDSFGLPAENAAIKYKSNPKKFTDEAIGTIRKQLEDIGASFDWSKYLTTSDPNFYKWTQWLFLQLFKHGLAEKRNALVNWCPQDQTVLANEQVVNGKCERCGSMVSKKELSQWFLKTTEFADELIDDLDDLNWPERVKSLQRDWIGRSNGAKVIFSTEIEDIEVFTTRPDTLFGVTALVLAPEHPLVEKLTKAEQKSAVETYLKEVKSKTNVDRQQQKESAKTAVFTGSFATVPLCNVKVPIWIADYVLIEYGTGAVMSVPAHDERDFLFAKTHKLPIKKVIAKRYIQSTGSGTYRPDQPTVEAEGILVLIKHWQEEKYICLKWKEIDWHTLLTGTIDEGFDAVETVKKEIIEETGYTDFEITQDLGMVDGLFYHAVKGTNKLVHGYMYEVQLKSGKREPISTEEDSKHEILWLTIDELKEVMYAETHKHTLDIFVNGYKPVTEEGSLFNSGEFNNLKTEEARLKIIEKLETVKSGSTFTSYRLRDWLVSRQRYWGAPIPIVYDPEGKSHPVKEEYLPLLLPEDVDFVPGGESPIARSREFSALAEELYGKGWHFETDTLDTFFDSSWYFFRYLSPTDESHAIDSEIIKNWLPVDLYIGGIEHATLHLLYARFVTKFLAKYGYIDSHITEPFKQLYNIGSINLHGTRMSKSKGNIVSPDLLVEHFGRDALRGYELFIGPMDVEAEWNNRGINGIHRFLVKLYQLSANTSEKTDEQQLNSFSKYLSNINQMIPDFRLNTVISEAMKFVNSVGEKAISKQVLSDFVVTLSPIFPFICEEIWQSLGNNTSVFKANWPVRTVVKTEKSIPVLINQKFVTTIIDEGESEVTKEVLELDAVKSKLGDKKVSVFYKKGIMVNLITD